MSLPTGNITLPGAILMIYKTPTIRIFRKGRFQATIIGSGTTATRYASIGIVGFVMISVGGETGFTFTARTGRARLTTVYARNAGVGGRIQSHRWIG